MLGEVWGRCQVSVGEGRGGDVGKGVRGVGKCGEV